MRQQQALMKFDPATGEEKPYPSQAMHYREYHGKVAWLFNPWSGEARDAYDIGSDTFGHLILPPGEPVYAGPGPLAEVAACYKDVLDRLGVQGHEGAIAEIETLRRSCGL